MCTKFFSDGDVHKYFSPYASPHDAFVSFMNVLEDLARRVEAAGAPEPQAPDGVPPEPPPAPASPARRQAGARRTKPKAASDSERALGPGGEDDIVVAPPPPGTRGRRPSRDDEGDRRESRSPTP